MKFEQFPIASKTGLAVHGICPTAIKDGAKNSIRIRCPGDWLHIPASDITQTHGSRSTVHLHEDDIIGLMPGDCRAAGDSLAEGL
jgi:hypothetical protein